ncbi:hypothetical protein [Caldimonas sp.]|uniref:hypothetical protein n=1 Tax=Caldimonas sp. TaxID=2838790 RepID=UPI003918B6A0
MSPLNEPPAQARPLYLVRSSLQLLLASALAEQARCDDQARSCLLFLPDLQDPALFGQALQAWSQTPFEQTITLEPRHVPGGPTRRRAWRDLDAELAQAVQRWQPTSVTVFNDRQDAGQRVLIEAAGSFPAARRVCAEDGAQAYTGYVYRRLGMVTRWRQKLRMGPQWCDVRVLGTHPLVQEFLALHPDLLRPELRTRAVRPFPAAGLGAPCLRHLAQDFCRRLDWDPAALDDCGALLTLNHSTYAQRNPHYVELVQGCVQALCNAGIGFAYKYHPRETQADYLGLARSPGTREVPRVLPVEMAYLLCRGHRLLVIAGMSTSLLTAALLLPSARTVALVHTSRHGDQWDARLLQALNIHAVSDADGVARWLTRTPDR